jgi:hypothetical protein
VVAGWVLQRGLEFLTEKAIEEAMNTTNQHKIHQMGNSDLLTNWLGPLLHKMLQ